MITNLDTTGYGVGWAWDRLEDMYNSPTVGFRIMRKGVGIEFDGELCSLREGEIVVVSCLTIPTTSFCCPILAEYEDDINRSPSMFFYAGNFVDADFREIQVKSRREEITLTVKSPHTDVPIIPF